MKRYRIAPITIATMLFMLGLGAANAQHKHEEEAPGHSHEKASPHGGSVAMTKQFHFETLFTPDEIRLYLYDGKQNPLQAKHWKQGLVKGTVKIQFRDASQKPIQLELKHGEPKVASTEEEHAEHLHAEHKHDEHAEEGHEEHKEADEAPLAVGPVLWLCPMHPDQNAKAKATCTICEMTYVPQDYLAAKVDLSEIKPGMAKATFTLNNLPNKKEKQTTFTQKIVLMKLGDKTHDEHGEHAKDHAEEHHEHDHDHEHNEE